MSSAQVQEILEEFKEKNPRNKIIAIRGLPGSGKTTLANLLGLPLELDELALLKFIEDNPKDVLKKIAGKRFDPQKDDLRKFLFEYCIKTQATYKNFLEESNKYLTKNLGSEFAKRVRNKNGIIALDYSVLPDEISSSANLIIDVSADEIARNNAFCDREKDILSAQQMKEKYNIIQEVEKPLLEKLIPANLNFENEHGSIHKMHELAEEISK